MEDREVGKNFLILLGIGICTTVALIILANVIGG